MVDDARNTASRGPQAIWAPWRAAYFDQPETKAEARDVQPSPSLETPHAEGSNASSGASFFSDYWHDSSRDAANHVVHRSASGLILLNRYPYANGHLLVVLGEPRSRLLDYDVEQRATLWGLVDLAVAIVERGLNPQGVNVGVNQGRAAGAGVPQHLHAHVVPRWSGDTNFVTTVAQIRVIPASLDAMAALLGKAATELTSAGVSSE